MATSQETSNTVDLVQAMNHIEKEAQEEDVLSAEGAGLNEATLQEMIQTPVSNQTNTMRASFTSGELFKGAKDSSGGEKTD